MSMESAITLSGDWEKPAVIASASITEERDAAIAQAKALANVIASEADLRANLDAKRALAAVRKAVVDARKVVKGHVDALGKLILRTEESFLAELERQEQQVAGRIANFERHQLEDRRAAEAEAARALKAQAEEAAQRQRELDAQQRALDAMAAKARSDAEREKIAARQSLLEDAKLEAELAAEAAPDPSAIAALAVLAVKVSGVSSKEAFDYEVEDEWTLAYWIIDKTHRNLAKVEVRRRDMLEFLNSGQLGANPCIPGLRVFKTVKTSIR